MFLHIASFAYRRLSLRQNRPRMGRRFLLDGEHPVVGGFDETVFACVFRRLFRTGE